MTLNEPIFRPWSRPWKVGSVRKHFILSQQYWICGAKGHVKTKLVQESTFCTIMVRSTFYPNLISSKMMTRKFHAPSSMANHHKCPLNYTLPNGGSNFQSDFFASLIADSDSWQKTAWRNYLSFFNILKQSWSNKSKTIK